MKKIVIIVLIFLILFVGFDFLKKTLSVENEKIQFYLKNSIGKELLIQKGKGKFFNIRYNLKEANGDYKLFFSGKGDVEFFIYFNDFEIIFPKKNEIFNSPIIIFKDLENNYLMFLVPPDNLYYFEFNKNEKGSFIYFNLYINKKEIINFNIRKIDSLEDGFEEYFKIYKENSRLNIDGGLITPGTSYTKIRTLGIDKFNIKYRIVDSTKENAVDRINEASFFGIENFITLNPVSLKFENFLSENIINELYFGKDSFSKIDSIAILTSGIRNKNDKLISYERNSKPTYKVISGEVVIDYKEKSIDKIYLLNPSPNFLKNKGISAYDIFYNKYIIPIELSIKYYNNESGLSEEKKSRFLGYALDFSDVFDVFNYNKIHFGNYPTSFLDGKECQFYLAQLYDFLKKVKEKSPILSINPKYFQLIMNSDIIFREVDNLSEISNFPLDRILVRNKPISYSYKLSQDEINEENLKKIFDFSLFYGIYPTFSTPNLEPFSIWDNQNKLKELIPFIKYYEIINMIEKRGFKPKQNCVLTDGSILRFGDYPEIYLTINGNGLLTIDKNSLKIDNDYKVVDLIKNEELNYKEEDGFIVLRITDQKVIKIFSEEEKLNETITLNSKKINFDINFFFPLLLIFLSFIIRKYKISLKLNPYLINTLILLILIIIKFYLNITSPYFIFLSIGIISILNSMFESLVKKRFLFNFSIIFFFISFIYNLITKSKINIIPPFYLYFDLYFYIAILFINFFIFYHFKWKLLFDFFIFISLIFLFFLSSLLTTPFYSPPTDLSFLINIILFIFIATILSIKNFKFFLIFLIINSIFVLYIFWDKIYYLLLTKKIFISFDFITYLLTIIFIYYLFILFIKKDFKKKPNLIYLLFFLIIVFNSLILNYYHLNTPNKFPFLSSISRLIFYIIFIIYLIFFTEVILSKKEE